MKKKKKVVFFNVILRPGWIPPNSLVAQDFPDLVAEDIHFSFSRSKGGCTNIGIYVSNPDNPQKPKLVKLYHNLIIAKRAPCDVVSTSGWTPDYWK